jgi:hypothetical protein
MRLYTRENIDQTLTRNSIQDMVRAKSELDSLFGTIGTRNNDGLLDEV